NAITGGWQDTDLIILAARPSVGKTAFALNLAMNATFGDNPKAVGIFSLEMGENQLFRRLVSARTLTPLEKINRGTLDQMEFNFLQQNLSQVTQLKIHIDDTFNLSISRFRARAKKMKRKYDVGLIIVDYLQL